MFPYKQWIICNLGRCFVNHISHNYNSNEKIQMIINSIVGGCVRILPFPVLTYVNMYYIMTVCMHMNNSNNVLNYIVMSV